MKPFGSELMLKIIETLWFHSSSQSKADGLITRRLLVDKKIPSILFILVLSAVSFTFFFAFKLRLNITRLNILSRNGKMDQK